MNSTVVVIVGGVLLAAALTIGWRFQDDLARARARAAQGSTMVPTRCGPIEVQQAGSGVPLLMVHGSGGGHDQGMAYAAAMAPQGIRVIAMSRFGYLRTPMPADGSAAAQADAHVCLLDALGIERAGVLGVSAGALSALQLAIRHPERVNALVLVVPVAYKPATQADSAPPLAPWAQGLLERLVGSDFLFWAALQVARDRVIDFVLATPPELVAAASAQEQARVQAMAEAILPISDRAQGLRADTSPSKSGARYALESIRAPTLVISARDDGYGTHAAAQYTAGQIAGAKFVGFGTGGHLLVGHDDEVRAQTVQWLLAAARP